MTRMTMTLKQSDGVFASLDDDTLALILSYCDYPSAARLTLCACRSLRRRLLNDSVESLQMWKTIFSRHAFSLQETYESTSEDYFKEIYRRRKLGHLLQRKNVSSFHLPNRCFSFQPVFPLEFVDDDLTVDAPPVDFDCDSFIFTSTATSSEILMLNPFDGELAVFDSVLDNTIRSTEGCLYFAYEDASQRIIGANRPDQDAYIAGDAIDYHVQRNHNLHDFYTPPKQVLLSIEDFMDIRVEEYLENPEEEIEMSFVGIESKPILREDGTPLGSMIAVGRMFANDVQIQVTELMAWYRFDGQDDDMYGSPHLCRLSGGFRHMDISDKRVFVTHGEDHIVCVYPLLEYKPSTSSISCMRYFPEAEVTLHCQDEVLTFCVEAVGQHAVVATSKGELQFWKIAENQCFRLETLSIKAALRSALGKEHQVVSPVKAIFVPRHLKISEGGVLSLHHSQEDGSVLVLWKCNEESWKAQARVNLPLAGRRLPQVHFDGHRIIVYGQDHIGCIILVYQVYFSAEHSQVFSTEPCLTEVSGGVVNATPQVRFVNRIRHAALGGLEYFDSLRMACNERFVVVNTKTGNLLSDGPYTDGLLVIDLQD